MKSTPILMKDDMALAAHKRLKTQTRRVLKPQPDNVWGKVPAEFYTGERYGLRPISEVGKPWWKLGGINGLPKCPYGRPGDDLWVKETHYLHGKWVRSGKTKTGRTKYFFKTTQKVVRFPDDPPLFICTKKNMVGWFKRNSLFMPRWASRTRLKIAGVEVQRIQDISEEDARAEGVEYDDGWEEANGEGFVSGFGFLDYGSGDDESFSFDNAKESFKSLWNLINSARGFGWDNNPWVWVLKFKRVP